jgi:hypothetical protein
MPNSENANVANEPANRALVKKLAAGCNAGWQAALPNP